MPTSSKATRRLTTIMEADVVGYSRLMIEDEISTLANLERSLMVFRTTVAAFEGGVVNVAGDSLLAEFRSASDSVECALRIQEELAELSLIPVMQFRIGIDLGDVLETEESLFGNGVNIAARMETEAKPGGICITGSVYEAASRKLEAHFEFIGEKQVKNVPQPIRTYSVSRHAPDAIHASGKPGPATMMVAAIGVLLGALAVTWFFFSDTEDRNAVSMTQDQTPTSNPESQTPSSDETPIPSLAILPFENLSDDKNQDYFADGISEDLITDLSKVSGLFVIARASSFRYRANDHDIEDIGEELNVRYLVTGSVRKLGSIVRIGAQLLDTRSGEQIWGDRYDRQFDEIFALQDEVLKEIVAVLQVRLTEEEESSLADKFSSSVEAYDYFLKGRNEHSRFNATGNQASKAFFEQAIAIAPDFADAYAWLAWAYARDYFFEWSSDPDAALRHGAELIEKAIEINPRRNVVQDVYGLISLYQGKHMEAVSALEKAISINPNYADSHAMLAFILNYAGRPEKSAEIMETAMQLNPLHTYMYLNVLGQSQLLRSRYDEAVLSFSQAASRNPEDTQIRLWLAASYALMGNVEDAEWQVLEILADYPDYSIKDLRARIPFKNPEHLKILLEGLRLAGLPEG